MTESDMNLIKMNTNFYYRKLNGLGNKIVYGGKNFYDKFERIDQILNSTVIKSHLSRQFDIAHALILQNNHVENIIFDYNGRHPDKFYHKAQLLLRNEGFINFTAYESKTPGHLHLYLHKGHTTLNEGKILAKNLSHKLAMSWPIEWRVFPSDEFPPQYNILSLPYAVFAKERGASWSKHM